MKYLLPCVLALLISSTTWAANQELGVGLMLGNPTAFAGKYWVNENHAIDGGMGLSMGKHSDFSLHSDYLLHDFDAFYFNDTVPLDFYYGLGARMEFADEVEFGARIPLGLVHMVKEKNADIFAEVAPIIDFAGRTGIELHFGIGARYYY